MFNLLVSMVFPVKTFTGLSSLLTAVLLFSALLLTANRSDAAEWWLAPVMRLDVEYNDNFSLTTLPHKSTRGTTIAPSLNFGVGSYIWAVNGNAEFVRQSYSDVNNEARDSQNYALSSQYATERMTWRLSGNESHSSLLVNQAGDPVPQVKQRKASNYGPSWSWMMTELTQLQLGYQKNSVAYEDGSLFGLSDYDSTNLTASLSNKLSAQSSIFISLGYSNYKVPAEPFKSRGTSAQAGVTHSFSDTLRTSFSVGVQRNVSEGFVKPTDQCSLILVGFDTTVFPPRPIFDEICTSFPKVLVSQDKTTSLFNAYVEKRYEVVQMSASLNRTLDPSGTGTIVQTDRLGLVISRPLTPLLTGNFAVDIYDFSSTIGGTAGSDRTFYQANPNLRWQLAEEWNLETSFRYSVLKYDNNPGDARSRSILFRLIYQGPKFSFSR